MRRRYALGSFAVLLAYAGFTQFASTSTTSSYQVVHGWPTLPEGFALGQVTGVQVDSRNHVFVFHRGDRPVLSFDGATGKLLSSWGDGMFGSAHGLTLDPQDNVWVTDVKQHQVFKFSNSGELLLTLGAKNVPGLDTTHFNKPTDVAVSRGGDVYISDGYGNSRVVKLTSSGKYVSEWGVKGGNPGEFDTPHGITVDSQGRVYVADRGNSRIQVFDADGKFLHQWKSAELGRPWGVSFAADGFLYVADGGDLHPKPPDRNHVLRLDLNGRILDKWGSFGSYDGQFYWAHDVAVSRTGEVYVTDVNVGMRVQKFVRR